MILSMSKVLQSTIEEAKQLKQKYIDDIVVLYRKYSTILLCLSMFVCRLCESELEHSAALSGAVTALRHDQEARLSSNVENMREQEKVFYLIS